MRGVSRMLDHPRMVLLSYRCIPSILCALERATQGEFSPNTAWTALFSLKLVEIDGGGQLIVSDLGLSVLSEYRDPAPLDYGTILVEPRMRGYPYFFEVGTCFDDGKVELLQVDQNHGEWTASQHYTWRGPAAGVPVIREIEKVQRLIPVERWFGGEVPCCVRSGTQDRRHKFVELVPPLPEHQPCCCCCPTPAQ